MPETAERFSDKILRCQVQGPKLTILIDSSHEECGMRQFFLTNVGATIEGNAVTLSTDSPLPTPCTAYLYLEGEIVCCVRIE